ncbi:MAG: hypothetical protein ACRD6B_09775 [Bryobacteraceae bacterium]
MTLLFGKGGLIRRSVPLALSALVTCVAAWAGGPAAGLNGQVLQYESSGDLAAARSLLNRQAQAPNDATAARALAAFVERHRDPSYRGAFLRWAGEATDPAKRRLALHEVVLLDFMNSKTADLQADLAKYRAAGGSDFELPPAKKPQQNYSTISIPGPLPAFARMAALNPQVTPDDLLPALARNIVTDGYQASNNESLQQTEYLKLLIRYVGQARELQAMAGAAHKIVVPACESKQTAQLLHIIGYRMRGSCGGNLVLETVNPTRAFVTIDSGFPLTKLEEDLRANYSFALPYAPTPVPVFYNAGYWLSALGHRENSNFLDAFLGDPSICRLYLGLSHLDRAAAEALRNTASPAKLKVYAHVLDFFGGMFQIRNGAAVTPGSPRVWASMVGVSPDKPGKFFWRLIRADDGWMAAYFDTLSRLHGAAAAYFTAPQHMRHFYRALRGRVTSPGPARPVFRASADMMLLTASLRIGPEGQPLIPGGLDVWRTVFEKHLRGKHTRRMRRAARSWRSGDDLVSSLFALCRRAVSNQPLKVFLALNDVDRARAKPMSPQLAARLVAAYDNYGAQYILFADVPSLSETSVEHYLDICASTAHIHNMLLRTNTLGTLQALTGLFDILVRQNSIPLSRRDATFDALIEPFTHMKDEAALFSAGRSGTGVLLHAAGGIAHMGGVQPRLVDLLVGIPRAAQPPAPPSPADTFLRIFDQQELISLDNLFALADGAAKGKPDPAVVKAVKDQLARFAESETLHSSLSSAEKNTSAYGYWSQRHIERESKFNLDALVKNSGKKDPRAALAPFLRDSLVGLLYAYYAPPGAQLLLANPLFVRNHDFIGAQGAPGEWRQTELAGTGWPESGGGRLTGSLIGLPYALASAEQNFLTPTHRQALIWTDLAPQIIANVTLVRWRHVTPEQIRWAALHIERGRTLLAAACLDRAIRPKVLASFSRFADPGRVDWLSRLLAAGDFERAARAITPAALYRMAQDPALQDVSRDLSSAQIAAMASQHRPDLTPEAIAAVFGTPKPILRHTYRPKLLKIRLFPALMGYSSRILAETWESDSLYYAALAEETGVPVNELDAYVPVWNEDAIEDIFATHLEDWPALVRSLHNVGASVAQRKGQTAAAGAGLVAASNPQR